MIRFSIFAAAGIFGGEALAAEAENRAPHPGLAIYQDQCVECHGEKGEGVDGKCDDPLIGNRSIESLARRIDRTMPEDHVERCVGAEARAVAEYIYEAFYSPAARGALHPPPLDLSRLTVTQYQASVADLMGRFRGWSVKVPTGQRGLKAHYSGTPDYKPVDAKGKKVDPPKDVSVDRIDDEVKFDFKSGSAVPGKFGAEKFRITWTGSIFAPDTGEYEFIIRTQNGARLWVNNLTTSEEKGSQLIDAWVSSGPEVREESGRIFLLGGRAYPIQLDFFTYKEATASIELQWKTPGGVVQTVPSRVLSPDRVAEVFVAATAFPADDRSYGYERGTSVSESWFAAILQGALQMGDDVMEHVDALAGTKPGAADRVEKLKRFCEVFTETAFRHPLSEAERKEHIGDLFAAADTPEKAVKRCVLSVMQSPTFLYPMVSERGAEDPWARAGMLALLLWDSLPDAKLVEAAKKDQLKTPDQLRKQAQRMLSDPRSKAKMRGFFHQWLELDRAQDVSKDSKQFPQFTPAVMADLRASLDLFLDDVAWGDRPDYRRLLLEDELYLNDRLAKLYGAAPPASGFQKVKLDSGKRAGVVTHPYLLTAFAYYNNTSPIHRGVFLTRNIVGMTLKPPPEATKFEDSKFDPKLTMREKVTEITRAEACMACHSTINPLGFSLENFDAIGRWRTKEKNQPIDPKGSFVTEEGDTVKLTGARQLAEFAAGSELAHRAFVRHLFHHFVKQPAAAYGFETLDRLTDGFEDHQYNIRDLLAEIAITLCQSPRS